METSARDLSRISQLLSQYPGIKQAAVVEKQNHLVAYLVGDLAVDRLPFRGKCVCRDQAGQVWVLEIADISEQGLCLLDAPRSWPIGKTITIQPDLPESPNIEISGRVTWHNRNKSSWDYLLKHMGWQSVIRGSSTDRTGIAFDPNCPSISKVIDSFWQISRNTELKVQDLRRNELRVPWYTNISVRLADGRTFGLGTMNISLTGMRLQGIPSLWKKGQALVLGVRLPGTEQKINIAATVWWHCDSQAGVKLHPTPAQEQLLHRSMDYLISSQGLSLGNLKHILKLSLPQDQIPQTFVMLEEMPMTDDGQVDYQSLPNPELSP